MASSSADVCYRHPQRESWTLCSRCGRTICPECQILTPAGVRCPTCVQETGGSVTWQRAGGEPRRPAPKKRRSRAERSAASDSERPRWMQVVGQMFAPGGETPALPASVGQVEAAISGKQPGQILDMAKNNPANTAVVVKQWLKSNA